MVNCPASLSASHKRERHYFATRDLAKEHAASLREKALNHGKAATVIRPSLAEAATQAEEILKPSGISLVEACRMAAAIRERENASKTLADAADLWLLSREGLRPKTLHNYKLTAKRLRKALGGKLLASITAEELQAAIAPPGSVGAAAAERVRNTKAFWHWSAKKGWCEAKIFAGVEMPAANKTGKIVFLTVAEAEALLRTAEQYFPQTVASYALQLFGGVRVWERKRLGAEHARRSGHGCAATTAEPLISISQPYRQVTQSRSNEWDGGTGGGDESGVFMGQSCHREWDKSCHTRLPHGN